MIKLKQENIQAKKDKVLARVMFDAGLFVGKKNTICDINFTTINGSKDGKLTLEASVL